MSESETEQIQSTKPTKKQITESQRKARIENLRLGREKRMANLQKRQRKVQSKQKYEVRENDQYETASESESSSSDDSEDELVITRKPKKKTAPTPVPAKKSKEQPADNQLYSEMSELKQMVAMLARKRHKKPRSQKTIINIPASSS